VKSLKVKIIILTIIFLIAGTIVISLYNKFMNKDSVIDAITIEYYVSGNQKNLGCLSVYVNDQEDNEYSFDNGFTWQKSKYGAVYQNGETTILVRNKDKNIIFEKNIDIDNIDSDAPIIKLNFDNSINGKNNNELLKEVTSSIDSDSIKITILEDNQDNILVSYLAENNNKKCYLLKKVTVIKKENIDEWIWPTDTPYQISRGVSSSHNGVDIYGPKRGSKIYAALDGEVVDISSNSSSGYFVVIKHDNGYYTRYAHMQNTNGNDYLKGTNSATKYIKIGQKVKAHDVIGEIGSSGNSTAIHLHFEVWNGMPYKSKVLDPLSFY